MKFKPIVSAFALVALSATAWPELSDRDRERATVRFLDQGRMQLSRVSLTDKNAAKLNKLDRAIYSLRRARTEVRKGHGDAFADLKEDVDCNLVRALDDQAEIYFSRRSLPLAKERVVEALTVIPYDSRSMELLGKIEESAANGSVGFGGVVVDRRFVERRASSGVTTPSGVERIDQRR